MENSQTIFFVDDDIERIQLELTKKAIHEDFDGFYEQGLEAYKQKILDEEAKEYFKELDLACRVGLAKVVSWSGNSIESYVMKAIEGVAGLPK